MKKDFIYTYREKNSPKIENEILLQRFKDIQCKIEEEYLNTAIPQNEAEQEQANLEK